MRIRLIEALSTDLICNTVIFTGIFLNVTRMEEYGKHCGKGNGKVFQMPGWPAA